MNFCVESFQYLKMSDQKMLVLSSDSSVSVSDSRMMSLIDELAALRGQKMSSESLVQLCLKFGLEVDECRDFLRNVASLISPEKPVRVGMSKIAILSDDSQFSDLAISCLSEGALELSVLSDAKRLDESFDLVINYQNDYDFERVKSITSQLADNQWLQSIYRLSHFLFIDNLYSRAERNPCHYCGIWNLKGQCAKDATGDGQSFYFFFEYVLNNKIPISQSLPLSLFEKTFALNSAALHLRSLLGIQNTSKRFFNPKISFSFDLKTSQQSSDLALHSEYCDCLQRKTSQEKSFF